MHKWVRDRDAERKTADWVAFYEQDGAGYRLPVHDLSEGGGFFRTTRPVPPGTFLDLVLVSRRDRLHVSLPGQVVWRGRKDRHRGMGVRFAHNRASLGEMRDVIGTLTS